jgi:hypothetical protein
VFRTYEPGRDRLVSVKVFRIDLLPEQAETLAEELQGLVEIDLDDPAIVKPLAAGLEGHTVYLAEEYVAAESLDVALKHYAPAPLDRALPFLGQLGGAIDFARARGVGHGALHPRDIFLTPELARATGFGIVQALERLGVRAPVRRPYSAPERVSGAAWSTPADVFALAAVAHELLTGKRPAGTGEVAAIAGEAAESNPELLRGVLTRALAEDPAARYPTAGAFVAALEAAANGRADESAAVVVPAWSEPSEEQPRPAAEARELAIELDHDVTPVTEAGDLDLRGLEQEATYDLGRIDRFEAELPASVEPPPVERRAPSAEQPVEPEAPVERRAPSAERRMEPVEPGETIEELRLRKRRPRPRARTEDVAAEEPAPFDLESAPVPEPPAEPEPESRAEPLAAEPEPEPQVEQFEAAAIAESEMEDAAFEEPFEGPRDRESPIGVRAPLLLAGPDRSRPAILPYAIVAMVALLAGFLAGYGLGSRERGPAPAETPPAAAKAQVSPAPSTPPPTPVEPAQREWSESRVEPPPPPAEASPPAAAKTPAKPPAPSSEPRAPSAERRAPSPKTPAPAPAAATGTLIADSRPTGARVVLDGKAVGKTPFKLANVKAGVHTVRLELAGYRTWVSEITVTGGRDTRVAGSLERIK